MVRNVWRSPDFIKQTEKIKDSLTKERIKKQIAKILGKPETGKPLRYNLKGERSVRIGHFRLIYAFDSNTIYFLRFEHRSKVYEK